MKHSGHVLPMLRMAILFVIYFGYQTDCDAQVETVAGLLAAADGVTNDLRNLVTQTSVEGQKTIGTATTEINGLENQLRKDVGTNISTPIQNLGSNVQNTANTLSYIVDHVNDLLTKQRSCLDLDLNLFEAGLQTTISQAKAGIPLVKAGPPRLTEFVFSGHTPNVVPMDGGPVTLSGFNLWQDRAPIVTLTSAVGSQTALVTLAASRQSNNEIIVNVPTAILQSYAGQCLFMNVQPRRAAFLGVGTVNDQPVSMPFCIADTALTEYQLSASMSYSCAAQNNSTVTTDYQHQSNSDCSSSSSVSANFGIPVPGNCRIIGAEPVKGNLTRRELGSTSAAISGETVVLTGHLDQAKCFNAWPVSSLESTSDWQYAVKATIQCDTQQPNVVNARSAWTSAGTPETDMCADLQKTCSPEGNQSDITVQVYRNIRGGSNIQNAIALIQQSASAAQAALLPATATIAAGTAPLGQPISGQQNLAPSAPQIGVKIYDKSGSTPGGTTLQLQPSDFGATSTGADYTPGVTASPARACATVKVSTCGY